MAIKQKGKSLKVLESPLAETMFQLKVLNGKGPVDSDFPLFSSKLRETNQYPVKPSQIDVFQLNIGYMCNQTCAHCHVDAGPDRKEMMTKEDLSICLEIVEKNKIPTVDITGGAPEMHPHFRWFVESLSAMNVQVMNRCNLTIIRANKKYHDLPEFFAKHKVQIISSLPHYSKRKTDQQRGDGVFEDSIKALQMLNEVGYGIEGTGLELNLVYNPSGAFLPGSEETLERDFKRQLDRKHSIQFNNLFAITNMPISRYLDYLIASGNYHDYMTKLVGAFNPATVSGLMCRNTISVSYDGHLYDCDFNQMLDLKVAGSSQHIRDFDAVELSQRLIRTDQHCYGCTAGAGSSCGGEIA